MSSESQREAFRTGSVPVAVYGLGKMGLPLATVFAEVCGNVLGVDIDPSVVESVNDGRSPVAGEPGLSESLEESVQRGALRATTDSAGAASEACLHVVIIPTLLDDSGTPDLSAVDAAVESIGEGLTAGDVVLVESTLPPGTCRDRIQPALAAHSGLDGDEFGLAFCPERTQSGRALADIRGAYPKVVGGRDEESARVAALVYDELTTNDIIQCDDCTTAEMVKLFEGVYRDVNIALANELSTLTDALSVDVRDAIDAANTQPYCDIHRPGPGVGGHCIPYYPYFLMDSVDRPLSLVERAREVNESMPAETVARIVDQLEESGVTPAEATVVLLGVTYRAGVDETRAAPAYPIASDLTDRGVTVYAVDPVCSDMSDIEAIPTSIESIPKTDPDTVVLLTAHDAFEDVAWNDIDDTVVVDTRDTIDQSRVPHSMYTLGRGSRGYSRVTETDE